MSKSTIALIVFGGCAMCGAIASKGKNESAAANASAAPDPSAEAARFAAQTKAAELAKHQVAPNPWVIIGVLPIPHEKQLGLF